MKTLRRFGLILTSALIPLTVPAQEAVNVAKLALMAEQGSVQAQETLGLMYSTGQGVPEDSSIALNWLRRAAEGGSAEAQFAIGAINIPANGETLNNTEGVYWYRKAAEAGHPQAQFNLGLIYLEGRVAPANGEKAVEWLEKADANGVTPAAYHLGVVHDKGIGVPSDAKKAVVWYEKAIAAGDLRPVARLAWFYGTGTGVEEDSTKAKELLDFASETAGDQATLLLVASSEPSTVSVSMREVLAARAEEGDAELKFLVATLFEDGTRNRPADYEKAAKWFEKAADAGHPDAARNLAFMLVDPKYGINDTTRALPWLMRTAESGDAEAAILAGQILASRQSPDLAEAIRFLELAAKDSPRPVAPVLGALYLRSGNHDGAVRWLRRAAEAGDSTSAKLLANSYFEKGDATGAFAWNHRAADSGDADAAFNLGLAYETGKGTSADLAQAVYWYRQAAAKDNAGAQYRLGRLLYQGGEGVSPDEAEALVWLNKAAEADHAGAVEAVALLKEGGNEG